MNSAPDEVKERRRRALALAGVALSIATVLAAVVLTQRPAGHVPPPTGLPRPPAAAATAVATTMPSLTATTPSAVASPTVLTVPTAPSTALRPAAGVALNPVDRDRFLPATAAFLADGDGWVIAARCASTSCSSPLVRTTDGAGSFSQVDGTPIAVDLTPGDGPEAYTGTATLSAADADDLLVVESRGYSVALQVSADGGRTWQVPALPGQRTIGAVQAVATPGGFWILSTSRADGGPLTLYRLDAGSTAAVGRGTYSEGTSLAAAPAGSAGGEAYAYSPDGALAVLGQDGLLRLERLPRAPGVVTVSSTGVLIESVQISAALGSGDKLAWRSTDGGSTWRALPAPPFANDLGDLTEIAPRRLLLNTGGGASTLSLSTDGGRSYLPVLSFGDGGVGFTDVSFTDTLHGYAVYGTPYMAAEVNAGSATAAFGLYRTADGGATWTRATSVP